MSSTAAQPSERPLPGPIPPTETLRFRSRDGTGLYGEWFAAPNPRAGVLVVHGYAEHCGRYREVAHVLTGLGLAVLSFDMRGHGRADGQRGHINDIGDCLDDLDAATGELGERLGRLAPGHTLPCVLLGHSYGALVVLRALTDPDRKPAHTSAAVLSSPFLRLRDTVPLAKRMLGQAASRWLPRLSLPNDIRIEDLTSDQAKQAERRVDTLCHDVAGARWYTASLQAQEYVADYASRIDVPTLWLVAHDDRLADPARSRVVHARLRAPSVYHGFPGMQHEVFNECERARVFALLAGFLKEILSIE